MVKYTLNEYVKKSMDELTRLQIWWNENRKKKRFKYRNHTGLTEEEWKELMAEVNK